MKTTLTKAAYWIGFWRGYRGTRRKIQHPRKWL